MHQTPIKIRGKRASARMLNSTHNSGPKGKCPLSPASRCSSLEAELPRQNPNAPQQTACIQSLTSLERLPVELLENIFSYCLNPSLPQASIAIGRKLNSKRVKHQLVLRALSSPNSFEYPGAVYDVFPTLQEQAKVQSAILRLPWVTLPFLRQLIPDYIVHTIIRELGTRRLRWMGDGPMVTEECEPMIRQYLEDNAARFDRSGAKHLGLPAYLEMYWHDLSTQQEIVLGIGLRDGLVTLRERDTTSDKTWDPHRFQYAPRGRAPHFNRWRIFGGVEGCQIPDKLLRGPWSDEKCEFLELVIRGNAKVDRVNSTSGEVAEQGFWEAIEEHNARAVRALVARIGPRGLPEDAEVTWYPGPQPCYTNEKACEFIHAVYREDPIRRGVGIVPRQEHLRRTLQEGCPEDILLALLGAAEVNFDLNDPEMRLWVYKEQKNRDRRATIIQEQLLR